MARYVVVEFDNDQTADAFISKINHATDAGKNYRVAGIFYRPTRWCECPVSEGYTKGQVAIGAKYGCWNCTVCRRPRRGTHQPHNLLELKDQRLSDQDWSFRVSNLNFFEVPTNRLEHHKEV